MLRSVCKIGVCFVCLAVLIPFASYVVLHYFDFRDKVRVRSASFTSGTDEEFLLFMIEDEEISAALGNLLQSCLRLLGLSILTVGSLICYTGFAVCPMCWCCCWFGCCFLVLLCLLLLMWPAILMVFLAMHVENEFTSVHNEDTDDRSCDADIGIC